MLVISHAFACRLCRVCRAGSAPLENPSYVCYHVLILISFMCFAHVTPLLVAVPAAPPCCVPLWITGACRSSLDGVGACSLSLALSLTPCLSALPSAFAELQTDMSDLTSALEHGRVIIHEHKTYVLNVLFPGVHDHPVGKDTVGQSGDWRAI